MAKNFPSALVSCALLLFIGAGCNWMENSRAAQDAVEEFHERYNKEDFGGIYKGASDQFKESTSEEEFLEFMSAVHRKLGEVRDVSKANWRVNATPLGTQVTLGYSVTFEKGSATESFIYTISGNEATLLRYDVNSRDLITN